MDALLRGTARLTDFDAAWSVARGGPALRAAGRVVEKRNGDPVLTEIIVVTSGKGGVGKTTTSASIACGLASRGKKVAVIDFDIGLRNLAGGTDPIDYGRPGFAITGRTHARPSSGCSPMVILF